MSERYTKLFALPESLYTEGAPIVIAAGVLLKDNQTDKILAQLKLKNTSEETIKSVKVSIQAFGKFGTEIKEVHYEYVNLSAKSGDEFGSKSPIELNNNKILYYSVVVSEVLFENGSVWKTNVSPIQAKKASSEQIQQTLMNKNRTNLKKFAFIPLILAVAGILFSVIYYIIYFSYSSELLVSVLSSNIVMYLISLTFPLISVFVLLKTNIMKTSKVIMRIGFILLGVQALAAILYLIALLSDISGLLTILVNFYIPGDSLLTNIFSLFRGHNFLSLLSLISSLCFFGKTIVSIILCKKVQM